MTREEAYHITELDVEWTELILTAKAMGYAHEEIRALLRRLREKAQSIQAK